MQMNNKYKLLRCNEYLNEQIETLIEVFTKYYGDSRREEIEDKFRNALLIGYMTPIEIKTTISSLKKEKTRKLLEEELKKIQISIPLDELTDKKSFEFYSTMPINSYAEFYRLHNLGKEGRREEYISNSFESLKSMEPRLTEEEFQEMIRTNQVLDKYKNVRVWVYNAMTYFINLENAEKDYQKVFDEACKLIHKIDPNITIDNYDDYLDNSDIKGLDELSESIPRLMDEYNKDFGPGSEFHTYLEQYAAFKEKINKRHYKEYVIENIDLIPEINREVVKNYLLGNETNYEIDKYIKTFFPESLDGEHPLKVFSKEQDEVLASKEESDWKKDEIRKKRIKYYNAIGIRLGSDYNAYAESEVVKRYTPTYETVEEIQKRLDAARNKRNNALFNEEPKIKRIKEKIDSLGLLDRENSFNAKLYFDSSVGTFINPNLIKTKDGYRSYPILAMKFTGDEYLDHNIIHELNHIFELSLNKVEGNQYQVYCGWEHLKGTIGGEEEKEVDTLNPNKEVRSYELFNEIINELIAQEIGTAMHESGIYIFNTPNKASMKNATSYEHTFFLVRDFFNTFKQKIIESRSNGNIQVIWDEVGKENFDALNDLFRTYNEHFSGFGIYNLLDDMRNKKDTERTRIYYDLVRKKDEILDKMNKHSMLRGQKSSIVEDTKVNQ